MRESDKGSADHLQSEPLFSLFFFPFFDHSTLRITQRPFQPRIAAPRFVDTAAESGVNNSAEYVSGAGAGEYFRHSETGGRERRECSGRHD